MSVMVGRRLVAGVRATGAWCVRGEGDVSDEQEMTSERGDALLRSPRDGRELTDGQIMTAWRAWLYETHGADLPEAVLDAVYGKAWEDGHSAGLYEVESYFIELVELAEKIRAVR